MSQYDRMDSWLEDMANENTLIDWYDNDATEPQRQHAEATIREELQESEIVQEQQRKSAVNQIVEGFKRLFRL